jgi:hypothetical protein
MALEDFLQHHCPLTLQNAILLWLTDNEGTTWSINKGSCSDPSSAAILARILHYCDMKHLQILALWVPRERNQLADYLSHLSTYLDRDEVAGRISQLLPRGHSDETGEEGSQERAK